jgi:uncharacterized protein
MKLLSATAAILGLLTSSLWAADATPLTFNGVLTLGDETRFGLVNQDATRSGWLSLGNEFAGYTLKGYDAATKTLTLEQAGQEITLSLSASKMTGESETKASIADAELVFERMQFEKVVSVSLEKTFGAQSKMMAQQFEKQSGAKVDPAEMDAFQQELAKTMIEAMQLDQMKKEMTQIYADTFTKGELSAMAAFYSTPAGVAMIEKQPDVQARMQELMMPRMMAAMPKVQQMSMSFAQKLKAKAEAAKAAVPTTPTTTP